MHLCELLDTKKGRGILMQEATISKAFRSNERQALLAPRIFLFCSSISNANLCPFSSREGNLVDLRFERNANQSLGIAFNIPARVSAMNWVSQQRLVFQAIHSPMLLSLLLRIRSHPLLCNFFYYHCRTFFRSFATSRKAPPLRAPRCSAATL